MSPAGEPGHPIRILALGDSYTIGESVAPSERWPSLVVERMRARGIAVAAPEIVATTGWTSADLLAGIERASPEGPFDVVTLLIGVNDQYQRLDVDGYRARFEELLERAVRFAGGDPGRTIVVSVPDWGVTPFAQGRDRARIAGEIDDFNAAARAIARRHGARWVDVTDLSRSAADQADMFAPDGLHPSGNQYRVWTDRILEEVLRAST